MGEDDFEAELDHLATLCTHLAAVLRLVRADMAMKPDDWHPDTRKAVSAAYAKYEEASTP